MQFLLKPLAFIFIIFFTCFLKSRGLFKKELALIVLKIIMNLTLPASVITAFASFEGRFSLLLLSVVGLVVTIGPYFATYVLTKKKAKEERVYYMINMSGFNIGCYGLPVVQSFYGEFGALLCIMFDLGNSVMMSSGNYAFTSLLLHTDEDGTRVTAGAVLKRLFSSVPLDCYVILTILSLCGFSVPRIAVDFIAPLANANAFLSMFMLGLLFSPKPNAVYLRHTAQILAARYLLMTAAAFLCYHILPLDIEVRRILCVLLFCPIGSFAPAFIEKCHGDGEMAAFTNSVSIIFSLVIMTSLTIFFQSSAL